MPQTYPAPDALWLPEDIDGERESAQWCGELRDYGLGEDHTWGFRVYRTVFTPGSDEDFKSGLDILRAYLHYQCFDEVLGEYGDPCLSDVPNQQLWQRLRLDCIEDQAFDNAPAAAIQRHFQQWIESQGYHLPTNESPDRDSSLKMAGSSGHRFCIIIDADALQNLLRYPLPVPDVPSSSHDPIGVKVLDVECNDESLEYEEPFQEGWLWSAPWELAYIWFECRYLAPSQFRDVGRSGRPIVWISYLS